jgi:serine/threonine-protein phosphatase 2A regulatory subunit A
MAEVDPKNALYPITVLIDELKSDEKQKRINSVTNLATIAIALGKERTRSELLPYLLDLLDDEEEVLLELAKQLQSSFLDYVGGPNFASHLLKPLERLCEIEETTVRN